MKHIIKHYLPILLLLNVLLGTMCVSAKESWFSYEQTEWNTQVPAPYGYEAVQTIDGLSNGNGAWKEPSDMYIRENRTYVLDSGNNRVVILDNNFKFVSEIKNLVMPDGSSSTLNDPSGIFVVDKNEIYIADSGNKRGICVDASGKVLHEYLKPQAEIYTSNTFTPKKIIADSSGMVYILSESVFQGAIVFRKTGEFESFYGSPDVQVTGKLLFNYVWKKILSKEQRDKLPQFVPVEFSNIEIDREGLIYTCSQYTNNNMDQIRRLNYLGDNTLKTSRNYGEKEFVNYRDKTEYTTFVDVTVNKDLFIFGLDNTRGRVYVYDYEGERLLTFGTLSDQIGGFRKPVAIAAKDEQVLVLDEMKNTITVFTPTVYGNSIINAVNMYQNGDYLAANDYWETVITLNANNELAYRGMGQAMMKMKQYDDAIFYFRLGYDRTNESRAFKLYRTEWIHDNIAWLVPILIVVVLLLVAFTTRQGQRVYANIAAKREAKPKSNNPWICAVRNIRDVAIHPVDSMNELKYRRYSHWGSTIVIVILWFFIQVMTRQLYGFRFNYFDPTDLNIVVVFLKSIVLFFLFCIVNWAVCTLMDGEGKFREICTFVAYAMVPYLVIKIVAIVLSNVLVLEEAVFLNWFVTIGAIWSLFLLFQAIRIVHQYTTLRSVFAILISILGIGIILFLLLLIFSLFQQMYSFVINVVNEIIFRG